MVLVRLEPTPPIRVIDQNILPCPTQILVILIDDTEELEHFLDTHPRLISTLGLDKEISENILLSAGSIILHDLIDLSLFALLHPHQALVDGVLHGEPCHERRGCLPDTKDATKGLLFHGGVPPGVEHDDAVCHGEVKSDYSIVS